MGVCTTALIGLEPIGITMLIVGAWLFVISDAFNAWGRFVKPVPNERLVVMSTYIVGQFLMVIGYIIAS